MCGGVKFKHVGKDLTIYFPNPKAVMSVRLKSKDTTLVKWGSQQGRARYAAAWWLG